VYDALTFAQQPPNIREKLPTIGARAAMMALNWYPEPCYLSENVSLSFNARLNQVTSVRLPHVTYSAFHSVSRTRTVTPSAPNVVQIGRVLREAMGCDGDARTPMSNAEFLSTEGRGAHLHFSINVSTIKS
jgi:hypothetical protein